MNIEKMREEFEAWTGSRSDKEVWQRGERSRKYKNPVMQNKWEAWRASRESLVIELPSACEFSASDSPGYVLDMASEAIHAVGAKTK